MDQRAPDSSSSRTSAQRLSVAQVQENIYNDL